MMYEKKFFRPWFKRLPKGLLRIGLIGWAALVMIVPSAGQSPARPSSDGSTHFSWNAANHSDQNPVAPQYLAATTTHWDFGLRITAGGNASGITGTVPIPLDWPEQTIVSVSEIKPANVGKLKFTNPTKESRMMTFQVPRMGAGETVEVYLRFQIDKRNIGPPTQTDSLHFPPNPSAALKAFLKPSPYIESRHKRIAEIAEELRDESISDWEQVEAIYQWVRKNVRFEFDPQIRSCLEALDAGKGDCEELSSLFIAICRAMKIPARAVLIPEHTYPEFYLETEKGTGYWFPCQVAGEYQFGSMSELRPVLHKGDRFRVPGQSKETRYLQPTLVEKSGRGNITIQWIAQPSNASETPSPPQ